MQLTGHPLGTMTFDLHRGTTANWASWIRTSEYRSQSPVPYRLAIAQKICIESLELTMFDILTHEGK